MFVKQLNGGCDTHLIIGEDPSVFVLLMTAKVMTTPAAIVVMLATTSYCSPASPVNSVNTCFDSWLDYGCGL